MPRIPSFEHVQAEGYDGDFVVDERFRYLTEQLLSEAPKQCSRGLQRLKFTGVFTTSRLWLKDGTPFYVTVGDEDPGDTSLSWGGTEFAVRASDGVVFTRARTPRRDGVTPPEDSAFRRTTADDVMLFESSITDRIDSRVEITCAPRDHLKALIRNRIVDRAPALGFLARSSAQ